MCAELRAGKMTRLRGARPPVGRGECADIRGRHLVAFFCSIVNCDGIVTAPKKIMAVEQLNRQGLIRNLSLWPKKEGGEKVLFDTMNV
jgi:hypothetical protein